MVEPASSHVSTPQVGHNAGTATFNISGVNLATLRQSRFKGPLPEILLTRRPANRPGFEVRSWTYIPFISEGQFRLEDMSEEERQQYALHLGVAPVGTGGIPMYPAWVLCDSNVNLDIATPANGTLHYDDPLYPLKFPGAAL